MNSEPLLGCEVLPPLQAPQEAAQTVRNRNGGATGRSTRRNSGHRSQRFTMFNTFVDRTLATLPRTDALVWLVLYRDAYGGTARSAQAYIAQRSGVCVRTVKTAIRRLIEAGLLEVVHQGGLNRGLSIYRVLPHRQAGDRGNGNAP